MRSMLHRGLMKTSVLLSEFVEICSSFVGGGIRWTCGVLWGITGKSLAYSLSVFFIGYFLAMVMTSYSRNFDEYLERVIIWGQAAENAPNARSWVKRFLFECCYSADAAYSFGKKIVLAKVVFWNLPLMFLGK